AATLLEMKSNMLLPSPDTLEEESVYEEDPKEELIRRLVEYRKYKAVVNDFEELEARSQLIFSKLPTFLNEEKSKRFHNVSFHNIMTSLQKLNKRKRLEAPKKTKIHHKE